MTSALVLMLIFVCIHIISGQIDEDFVVNTELGRIRGLRASDGDYVEFLGIPYASLKTDNPFRESDPYPPFQDIFEANNGSAVCPQYQDYQAIGTIDCLQLHVYVPMQVLTTTSSPNLPVMVWIHGGGFTGGSGSKSSAGPKYLIRHDVIIVSINYRLGPYGFMCLDIPEVPGNQGLKDQLLAFRWIRDNIEAFGGDITRITMFGESAGGHSIDLHLISSKEILFNNVILQSGSSLATTVIFDPDKEAALKIVNHLGFETKDVKEALDYISKADVHEVIRAERALNIVFKPCVEKEFEGVNAFLLSHWVSAKIPKVKNLSILTGFNDDEMIMSHATKDVEHFKNLQIFNSFLALSFNFGDEYLGEMESLVRNFYVGDGELNESMKWDIINFDSDFTYIHPIHRSIGKYMESGAENIFYYKFSYVGARNFRKMSANLTTGGAAHADDLGYIFDRYDLIEIPTEVDQMTIDRMTTMWTNFAKYSNPTPDTSELLTVRWLPITKDNLNYINIDSNLTIGSRPLSHRMAFWDLFFKLNQEYLKHGDDNKGNSPAAKIHVCHFLFICGLLYLL